MNQHQKNPAIIPFSLKNAPSFIERQMPVGRVSAETYKERKAGAGQTLTALGSYWKGRKPLVLVRATVLGCLLPATSDPLMDLRIFLMLMGMDDAAFVRRIRAITPAQIDADWLKYDQLIEIEDRPRWREDLLKDDRIALIAEYLTTLPYDDRLAFCFRPEELPESDLLDDIWDDVNSHLGTQAHTIAELIEQLGIMRFGHRPRLADTFAGGGSIPFEAARIGCDVYASDLNPIACMLTWGGFNVLRTRGVARQALERAQQATAAAIETEFQELGIENDATGNRAKAFLHCLETVCPKTGWRVPMAGSWIVSKTSKVVAELIPDATSKSYRIKIVSDATAEQMKRAEKGTVQDGRLVHQMNPERDGVSISVIRGDYKEDGVNKNRLRRWDRTDFMPRPDDIWQERLFCVQWITKDTLHKHRQKTFFAEVTEDDLRREKKVQELVAKNLSAWQAQGLVPDMPIEPGEETTRLFRERGWTHWHHLFSPRQLLLLAKQRENLDAYGALVFANGLNFHSKLCGINSRSANSGREMCLDRVFINQALNTLLTYGVRSSAYPPDNTEKLKTIALPNIKFKVESHSACNHTADCDLYVTDPPYADAVNYHEITEYFISWLRTNPPQEFSDLTWDSQRTAAIKGSDEKFRSDMVAAYKAMAAHMPDNGIQVVMFTHQDAGVWADLAAIMWAAGLRVSAAWNIVTETASALKEGNYVQGTILLVLRKRIGAGNARRMDIEGQIEVEVDKQIKALHDLADDWTSERLYTDGDLQLAAYAAALRVITNYETIDRVQVGADVYRKLKKGERTVIRDLIDYAASVANNKLVPEGFSPTLWRDLEKTSRFYVRMLDMESKGATKAADFMDFAKTFSVPDYKEFMASTKANEASLAGAEALKARNLGGPGFGSEPLRRVLFAVYKTIQKDDPKDGVQYLKLEFGSDYWSMRGKLIDFAKYIAAKTARTRPKESAAADLLAQKLEVDRV